MFAEASAPAVCCWACCCWACAAGRFPSVSGKPVPAPAFSLDSGFVFTFQSSFQCSQCRLVAVLSSAGSLSPASSTCLRVCAADGRPGCESVPALQTYGHFGVSFCVAYHFLDFIFVQTKEALMVIFCSLPLFLSFAETAGYRQHRYRR